LHRGGNEWRKRGEGEVAEIGPAWLKPGQGILGAEAAKREETIPRRGAIKRIRPVREKRRVVGTFTNTNATHQNVSRGTGRERPNANEKSLQG